MIRRSDPSGLRIALFAGSFNPFTTGHLSIVERALPLFDKIIIGIGRSIEKKDNSINYASVDSIKELFEAESKIEVREYDGLTVEFAKECDAQFLLRGVRSITDYEYERKLADVNRMLSGIETIMMFALPELEVVSSSMVRELTYYGQDVTRFLPNKKRMR